MRCERETCFVWVSAGLSGALWTPVSGSDGDLLAKQPAQNEREEQQNIFEDKKKKVESHTYSASKSAFGIITSGM